MSTYYFYVSYIQTRMEIGTHWREIRREYEEIRIFNLLSSAKLAVKTPSANSL